MSQGEPRSSGHRSPHRRTGGTGDPGPKGCGCGVHLRRLRLCVVNEVDGGARFCVGRMEAKRPAGLVEGERDFASSLREESAEGGVRHGRLIRDGFGGFGGSECSSRL
eukprot:1089563-Pleurochrysis_carterae.AAC.1